MQKKKLRGDFRLMYRTLVLLLLLFVGVNLWVYTIQPVAGILLSVCIVIAATILYFSNRSLKSRLPKLLVEYGAEYAQLQKELLEEMALPYALVDEKGRIFYSNRAFREELFTGGKVRLFHSMFPGLPPELYPTNGEEAEFREEKDDKIYNVRIRPVFMKELWKNMYSEDDNGQNISCLYALYVFDITERETLLMEKEEERMVAGILFIDNYDEVLEGVEDVKKSLLMALVERKINKTIQDLDGIVTKLEKDRYFITMQNKSLEEMKRTNFPLLEEVKDVNIGNEMSVTLSIGIGLGSSEYQQNFENAKYSLEMALARGGDQVVLKEGANVSFFGGKTQGGGKTTRVKARIKADALKALIESADRVLIMGHPVSDADCIGAAVGIFAAAHYSKKAAHIVGDNVTSSIVPLIERFRKDSYYPKDMFVTREEAINLCDKKAVLVVVDTNRKSYVACPELLQTAGSIVVFDHHRQSSDMVDTATLSYVETYASSASEMVSEVLQYYAEDLKLRNMDAEALYAGIVMDTNNFLNKTGVRTFEAAAFLRRNGADVTRIRKMFRDDIESYKAKASTVRNAEIFEGSYAISTCPAGDLESPTVIAAQAANDLLGVRGIKASFVMTEYNEKIYISARSIDEVNVQLIMERLGGGGHLSIAGAQLSGVTVEEAKEKLKNVLREMKESNEI